MDNITPKKHTDFEKVKTFIKTNRTVHFFFIDIVLISCLLIVYYRGGIENDRSMSICLLGTYIVGKFFLNALHMYFHPFKCGLEICI
jgi:hypothetical protein